MVTNLDELKLALQQIVDDSGLKKFRTRHWERAKASLDYLNQCTEVYIITSLPGPTVEFVEVENAGGFSVKVPYAPYPEHTGLWRLGPFLASQEKHASKPGSELPAPPAQSARKDGALDKLASPPTEVFESA